VTAALTATRSRIPSRLPSWTAPLLPGLVAVALALVAIGLRWRGGDLPAHWFRVALVRRDGFQIWNNQWFGGHHTLGYGALFPVLGAAIGIWTVAVLSAGVSAVLVDVLIRGGIGRRCLPASLWFAAGTVTNVAVGRMPFALGLTVGVGALVAAQRRRPVLTIVLTVATAAASPVVSAFLAIVFVAWAWVERGRERRRFALLAAAALAPVLAVAVLYPQGGSFPFRWEALVGTLVVSGLAVVLIPSRHHLLRTIAVIYALAAIVAFVIPTPLGANLTRLGMYAAAPALLAVVSLRRSLLVIALVALWFWQWSPAFDAILRSGRDLSTQRDYYVPLMKYLDSVGAADDRTEVVPTARHWEAAYVAAAFPIARGWERQLDIRFNKLFYEPGLTAARFHDWLKDEGVDRVALPDAALDDAGKQEAALLAKGLPFLREVWSNPHWRVWEVVDSPGLVDGPATVIGIDAESIDLDVTGPGDVTLRVRGSAFWRTDPPVCVEATSDDWIVLRHPPLGPIKVFLDGAHLVTGDDDPCAAVPG
jgi:hypothetical protein